MALQWRFLHVMKATTIHNAIRLWAKSCYMSTGHECAVCRFLALMEAVKEHLKMIGPTALRIKLYSQSSIWMPPQHGVSQWKWNAPVAIGHSILMMEMCWLICQTMRRISIRWTRNVLLPTMPHICQGQLQMCSLPSCWLMEMENFVASHYVTQWTGLMFVGWKPVILWRKRMRCRSLTMCQRMAFTSKHTHHTETQCGTCSRTLLAVKRIHGVLVILNGIHAKCRVSSVLASLHKITRSNLSKITWSE